MDMPRTTRMTNITITVITTTIITMIRGYAA
jgi:hypothetical protein